MLIKQIPAWVAETNAWVVADEPGGKAIVIDAPPEPQLIGAYLAEINVDLVGIILTHGHGDHTGGASVFVEDEKPAIFARSPFNSIDFGCARIES